MSTSNRRDPRFRVHLEVRYQQAIDFVQEYAENLSKGGLFLRGGQDLQPRQSVLVEIGLPGYGTFKVEAEVAHVLDAEQAAQLGRHPGAGLAITKAPSNYRTALHAYLRLLGRRRDCVAYADQDSMIEALAAAGYDSMAIPPADELTNVLRYAPKPVLGLVVSATAEAEQAAAVNAAGMTDRLHVASTPAQLERLLPTLDAQIPVPSTE